MFVANSIDDFQQLFINRLNDILQAPSLGAFILVLANALQDKTLYDALMPGVIHRFDELKDQPLDAPSDDATVFERLKQIDLSELQPWKTHACGPWKININSLRSYRPARSANQTITSIRKDFDHQAFHFNKPFLKSEILWEGDQDGLNLRVLYNKFPSAPWHILIVPEPLSNHPQLQQQKFHEQMFKLVEDASHLPGFGLGYNSLGAYASVNHLHYQGFISLDPLPIEDKNWIHNGGQTAYPLNIEKFVDTKESWQYIHELHQQNMPYNLLYRPGHCYVTPQTGQIGKENRKKQGLVGGWPELSGVMTVNSLEQAQGFTVAEINEGLNDLNPSSP